MPIDYLDDFINNALREDVGDGDHTSRACIPPAAMGKAQLLVKEEGILAGVDVAVKILTKVDPEVNVEVFLKDGQHVMPMDIAFIVEGKIRALLKAERLLLNIMQRMSGIATTTSKYAERLKGLKTRILDTGYKKNDARYADA